MRFEARADRNCAYNKCLAANLRMVSISKQAVVDAIIAAAQAE
jgi:hypothetical protein